MVVKLSCTLSLDQDVLDWARNKSTAERRSLSQFVSDTLRDSMSGEAQPRAKVAEPKSIEQATKKAVLMAFSRLLDIMEKQKSDQLSAKAIQAFIQEEIKK